MPKLTTRHGWSTFVKYLLLLMAYAVLSGCATRQQDTVTIRNLTALEFSNLELVWDEQRFVIDRLPSGSETIVEVDKQAPNDMSLLGTDGAGIFYYGQTRQDGSLDYQIVIAPSEEDEEDSEQFTEQ